MAQLISMLLMLLLPAPTVAVTVQMESGAAIVGLPITFRQEISSIAWDLLVLPA